MFIFADSNYNTMASVREVYTTLQGLANKDERGFVTPAVFNQFAAVAQQKVFNNIFLELERAQAQPLAQQPAGAGAAAALQLHPLRPDPRR